jgi:hypothetical protein
MLDPAAPCGRIRDVLGAVCNGQVVEAVAANEFVEPAQRDDANAIPRHLETNTQRDVGLDVALRADG